MHASTLTRREDITVRRERIETALNDLDHVLPGQGPILDFVHHNTLHGYEHLPFEEALAACEAMTGISGYLPEARYREFYRQGRINDADLSAALEHASGLQIEQQLLTVNGKSISRRDLYRTALLFDLQSISVSQLNWQIDELDVLDVVQADVPEPVRTALLAETRPDRHGRSTVIRRLWNSILNKLDLEESVFHPENMMDLSEEQAEKWLDQAIDSIPESDRLSMHKLTQGLSVSNLNDLLAQVGDKITLRGFILALSGIDSLDFIRPQLIRICASVMDEGMAAWPMPGRRELGLYAAWRNSLSYDLSPFLHELADWPLIMSQLADDAVDTIIIHLSHLDIPEAKWAGYLRRLALELPGWSGMINWRQHHPDYPNIGAVTPKLADYLAIRLTLDRLWLNQICHDIWKIEARFTLLEAYFRKNLSEFMVRRSVFQGELPEYLTQQAESLINRAGSERHHRYEWQQLSDRIRTWQLCPIAKQSDGHAPNDKGWRLFRLCQHLGLNDADIDSLQPEQLLMLLRLLDDFAVTQRSKIWLDAYERHYREDFFQALHANDGRGRWAKREQRPDAQVVFCMDEREESFRRHLEEINPAIETLGVAGFFGVPMNYQGLDDDHATPLCPVVIKPAHRVDEIPKRGEETTLSAHKKGHAFFKRLAYLLQQRLRRDLLSAHLTIDIVAPFTLMGLLGDMMFPNSRRQLAEGVHHIVEPPVATELLFTRAETPAFGQPRPGFTDNEQAERIEGLLRSMGLTDVFAPIVCMIAHGSTSLNNPHEAAHDCGACGGRRGGPNARVFAAMANRPEVRTLLSQRGINIPEDCRFVGAQHDTCNDALTWYDLETLPNALLAPFERIRHQLHEAQELSAHERCRRFFSADGPLTPQQAFQHVNQRAADTSQVRPEFGHATNAAAVIGRRAATRGLFLDRRAFLISYDAAQDPDGTIIENILLTAGPVGAGINLEYYFSTTDNDRFGCGTKIPHNITGLFGVMEGASSDLRTGLPLQMVEIHEPMRLLILVEAKPSILEQIYARQESLRELIAGGWVHLSVKDPDNGEIFIFERGIGFIPWQAKAGNLPVHEKSTDYYRNQSGPLPPALIRQPDCSGVS